MMNAWVAGVTAFLTIAGCWTDLRALKIPNALTAGFAAAGLIYHAAASGWQGIIGAAIGGLAGILPLLLLYWFGGIGGGDVKWFGAFGVWTGAEMVLRLLLYSIVMAGGIAALLLILRMPGLRRWGRELPWPWGRHPALPGKGAVFPFMLAVAPAFIWLCASLYTGTGR
jgi:prepilin peptidase CpaA